MAKRKWSSEIDKYLIDNASKKSPILVKELKAKFDFDVTAKAINVRKQMLGTTTKCFCNGINNPNECYNCKYNDCIANDVNMKVISITEFIEFFKLCNEMGV